MLALEVEYLVGVCYASRDPSDPAPDWPVEIDRVFSALVATWAARGGRADERAALEWLEAEPAPEVLASAAESRSPAIAYVPPNDSTAPDLRRHRSDTAPDLSVLPSHRRRQRRRFPAAVPLSPLTAFNWPESVTDKATLEALQRLACDTAYVGHSASLVRCHFRVDPAVLSGEALRRRSRRKVYRGRLAELTRAFEAGERPQPGASVEPIVEPPAAVKGTTFGDRWLIFADAGGNSPDLRASAVAAQAFRKAVLSGFGDEPIPEIISGHEAGGRPSTQPHLAVLPLADVGWQWSEGRLLGMALCLPRSSSDMDETMLFRAVARVMRARGSLEDDEVSVDLPGGLRWRLVRTAAPTVSSLKPYRYQAAAECWATATPIVLDRHAKSSDPMERQEEIVQMISLGCERVGLGRPTQVVVDKHSAIRGAPSAVPSARSPSWCRWTLPGALAGRMLTHAVLEFAEPVRGPLVLGAGRFLGLGLCLPIE
jgi:CRISPR-associated protein Csb2